MGSRGRTARMRSPRPAKGSPGHPAAAASATCRRRGGLRAADSARRCSAPAPPGPPAAARRLPGTGADSRPGAQRLPLPASIVCRAAGRGRGEEAGGRKRSGGSAPRTPGPASREGRCRPAAAPGAGGLRPPASSARRVPAPRDCVTGPPRLRPPGPGGRPAAPATSARPALLGYPAVPPARCLSPSRAQLGCVLAASIPPPRHTSSSPGHASLPATPTTTSPLRSSPMPLPQIWREKMETRGGRSFGRRSGEGRQVGPGTAMDAQGGRP